MIMEELRLENVAFSIGESRILNNVSFKIEKGETVGVIGPNGSGKTTLFNCISGFNKVESGNILLREKNVTGYKPFKRARAGLGRVFQNFGVFRQMTVIENMLVALETNRSLLKSLCPFSRFSRQRKATALELLEQVGIAELAKKKAGSLSGGQMRLLEIARTLALGADLFLLDEPTAGVAPSMKDSIAAQIIELKKKGKTVLIIEHDLDFIQRFCTRIIVLDVGQVVLDDTPENVRNSALLNEVYFGNASEHHHD